MLSVCVTWVTLLTWKCVGFDAGAGVSSLLEKRAAAQASDPVPAPAKGGIFIFIENRIQ